MGDFVYNPRMERDRLVTLFRRWSEIEAVSNVSPLYEVLGHAVADDPELLAMAAQAQPGQPPPNILFAAVHALLAGYPEDPLAAYYATLGGSKPADSGAAARFREFGLAHREELLPVIRTRLVQTNEVRRSAILLPAFASIAKGSGRPLALIEIGPSAGLNLLFDRYQYRYGAVSVGDPTSPVVLISEPIGLAPDVAIPSVVARAGIDINPLDVTDPDDVAWLRALLWPEHTDRLALLDAALDVARREPPTLLKGALFDRIPQLALNAPSGASVCIFATFVLNQFSRDMIERLRILLLELSEVREVHLVVMGFSELFEPGGRIDGDTKVWILRLRDGLGDYRLSSIANAHGRWIDWQPDSPWKPWIL